MLSALWVIVLRGIRKYLSDSDLKFPTFDDFMASPYGTLFAREDDSEKDHLWNTANWMHILFELLPAKKNKGLAMLVVPRFIEGWHVKYVTGSGQTHFTANRVRVFEIEGDTKACHRGKLKTKPKKKSASGTPRRSTSTASEDSGMSVDDDAVNGTGHYTMAHRELSMTTADYTHHRKRKSHAGVSVKREFSAGSTDSAEDGGPHLTAEGHTTRRAAKKARMDMLRMPPPPIPGRCTTDVLRTAENEECREAYREFQSDPVSVAPIAREETALLIPDLMRSESWANSAANISVPPPSVERNVTWGEIPLVSSSSNGSSNMNSLSFGSVFMNSPPSLKPEGAMLGNIVHQPLNNNIHNNMSSNGPLSLSDTASVFGAFSPQPLYPQPLYPNSIRNNYGSDVNNSLPSSNQGTGNVVPLDKISEMFGGFMPPAFAPPPVAPAVSDPPATTAPNSNSNNSQSKDGLASPNKAIFA